MARARLDDDFMRELQQQWDLTDEQLKHGPVFERILKHLDAARAAIEEAKPSQTWDRQIASRALVTVLQELQQLIEDFHEYINVIVRGVWPPVIDNVCELLRTIMREASTLSEFAEADEPPIELDENERVPFGYSIPLSKVKSVIDGLDALKLPFATLVAPHQEQRKSRLSGETRASRPGPHLDMRREVLFLTLKRRGLSDADIPCVAAAFCVLGGKDQSSWKTLLQKMRVAYRRFRAQQ